MTQSMKGGVSFQQKVFDSFSAITGIYALDHGEDEFEPGAVKLKVPSLCQTNGHCCGAIAAWSVYAAFAQGRAGSFARFYRKCNPCPENGMTEGEISRALRAYRIRSRTLRDVDFEMVRKWIDRGRPFIVRVGRENFEDGDHWVVAYGYRVFPRRVYLANYSGILESRVCVPWREFTRQMWAPRGRALLCYHPNRSVGVVRER